MARLRADARLFPALLALIAFFGVIMHDNATAMQAGTYAAIFAIAAIGLSILLGNVAQISIGQAGFFAIGAYTAGYLTTATNLGFPLAALLSIFFASVVGLALGFIALRFTGHYLAMATLAFGLIVQGVFHESKIFGGASGISNIPYPQIGPLSVSGPAAFWFGWSVVALVGLLSLNLLRGRTGRAFEALRNDELAAEVIGVPVRRYKIVAFAFAGALAGLAGSIYAGYLGLVVPDAVGVPLSVDFLLMVVLGGAGGVSGAIVGAALIGYLDISGHSWENWRQVIYGALVIAIVIGFPQGIAGVLRSRLTAPPRRNPPYNEGSIGVRAQANFGDPAPRPPPARTLRVQGVTKRFGGLVAVRDVSFSLEPGRLTSLIGPNGAGKTTLFNAISGVGRLTEGRIFIDGADTTNWRPHRVAALGVSRSFQSARLFSEMTVLENVIAGAFRAERSSFAADLLALPAARAAERIATERARATLARLGMEHLAGVNAKDLAFGDRRRVELARALSAGPWLLLLDEPAAGLNANERGRLREDLLALRAEGVTMLLIEHDMRLVMSISDRVMVLKFGEMIADGKASTVRNDPQVISAYLGTASTGTAG